MTNTVSGKGIFNVICDVCGFKKKSNKVRKRWDGAMVCDEDWEPRHSLDFYTIRNDNTKLPFTRPNNDGIDISSTLNPLTTTTPAPR